LFGGTLHDIGKLDVDSMTLKKTKGFDEEDMKKMRDHPLSTYKRLRKSRHDFSAELGLRHHRFQERAYPETLPETTHSYSNSTKAMIDFYARILALVDFYDAASTRRNEKFFKRKGLETNEVKALLLVNNRDLEHTINDLYNAGIFGDGESS